MKYIAVIDGNKMDGYSRDQALKEMCEGNRNNLEEVNANASISGNDSDKSQDQKEQSEDNKESKNQSTNDSAE